MPDTPYMLADILKSSDYSLGIFDQDEIDALTLYDKNGKPYLRDFCNNAERPAKPEEIVRQLFLRRLMVHYKYPAKRIAVYNGSKNSDTKTGANTLDSRCHEKTLFP